MFERCALGAYIRAHASLHLIAVLIHFFFARNSAGFRLCAFAPLSLCSTLCAALLCALLFWSRLLSALMSAVLFSSLVCFSSASHSSLPTTTMPSNAPFRPNQGIWGKGAPCSYARYAPKFTLYTVQYIVHDVQ